jgi:uncharacterized membrane protein
MSGAERNKAVRGILRPADIRRLAVFSVVLLVLVPTIAWHAGKFGELQNVSWRPGLNLEALAAAPPATLIHAIAILLLVITGWIMLALPKGDRRHRTLGWTWVTGMALMGLSSIAVPHGDSWVAAYLGGGSALVLLGFGVYFIRTGKVRNHARTMAMLMIALVLMTLLAVLPGRLLHEVLFAGVARSG